ncbi:CPBP family intramembrane metalloprotease [Treponema sp. OMZ 792]|uniref:CPBP family intramembrane glutamic endopeptidase n=1 Tax=unclassified Treponema TaxID=2638727 RepID=UPI0020A561B4|nr:MULTISPECIES: type II CAAX endopeptidase family protein [unclassified Treponema]UTC66672.1 CPBP family intramembrane metalloprotease [Treponema sp. OMZ 789]UTC69404.1 CPBP family intramembrane metalloprotease [Treponema sp. OMZ 790]UTC72118.1 CPBP family intramembrane metalloprotease [Treponema sp. OMZ 791]UTC74837.1 CPBP family intramembrane metalloprotease [Treponema sp. OMZ 792]UTC76819.1 CPBP family intramembrane metalloprotease [Treponema sp. OMZ 799]
MKDKEQVFYGILITITIFLVSTFLGSKLQLNNDFFIPSFATHSLMLLFSLTAIFSLKNHVGYKIEIPQFKTIWRPILIGLLATIFINTIMTIITVAKTSVENIEVHPFMKHSSALQLFVFVFIYASISEELLFRGFLLNMLKPLKAKGIKIFKQHISVSVFISAVIFGLGHLVLITTGVSGNFVLRTVIFTTMLGIVAGYYQEKYDNNAYAIIVHMAGNSLSVLGVFLTSINS